MKLKDLSQVLLYIATNKKNKDYNEQFKRCINKHIALDLICIITAFETSLILLIVK